MPTGFDLVFDYGGRERPDSVIVSAYPFGERGKTGNPPGISLGAVPGDRTRIPAELSPGEYLLEIAVLVPEGDASCYFGLLVE